VLLLLVVVVFFFSAWEESGGVAIAGALCFFDLCCTRYPSQFMSFSEGAVGSLLF
jgi:hypothetical protein